MELPHRLNASIIARKNGKYLLVKKPRETHAWQFPQGGSEKGETLKETALREFKEEIGTNKVKIIGDEQAIYYYNWYSKEGVSEKHLKKFCGQEIHLFLANFTGEDSDIQLDPEELAEYRWVTISEIKELIESPEYLKTILKIINAKS